jgi:GT2 family glycosyltransferase
VLGADGGTAPAGLLAMRVDFAHAVGSRLVAYGWIVGLSEWVASAVLWVGDREVDLLTEAIRVKRSDVTRNFGDQGLEGDEHGFLALLDLPELPAAVQTLRLQVYLMSGRNGESDWPILRDAAIAGATLRAHEGALRPLIPRLSARQRHILAGFGSSSRLSLRAGDLAENVADAVFALPVHVQLCCVLPGDILVVGGALPRPAGEVSELTLMCGPQRVNLLEGMIKVNEIGTDSAGEAAETDLAYLPSGFLFATRLAGGAFSEATEVRLRFSCAHGGTTARAHLRVDPSEARAQFAAHLSSVDPNARMELYERIGALLRAPGNGADAAQAPAIAALGHWLARQRAATIRDLPEHLELRGTRGSVHMIFDRAIRVADAGVFLIGWFHADAGLRAQAVFHYEGGSFNMSACWSRWPRPDVEQHLFSQGVGASEDPGFVCFVPRPAGRGPDYVAVRAESGRTWRVRVPSPPPLEPLSQAMRDILATLDPDRRGLLDQLDRHVGPAIGALWAARAPARHRAFREDFGPPCEDPWASVVVPLYGRHDFADVQLALFANDPDFRHVELIYVVDDPSIVQEFRHQCRDLYGMHGVPFTMAYPGDNLGFSGATNFGAAFARAPLLLMLNSDVMPREPGWLGRMLAAYRGHPGTGLLGAKLLYEDGTVQHAGMASRRLPQWQDLWINDHPFKGMNPDGLKGTREVECVTAACALIDTSLFRELGGLSEQYVIGDFEDSDLCHRVRAAGRANRVALDVALYHLERQSQSLGGATPWRSGVTMYNCWLYNRLWGAVIGTEHP